MHRLLDIQKKRQRTVVGLISGTSMDGVDAAVVDISGCGRETKIKLRAFECQPYPEGLGAEMIALAGRGSGQAICRLNFLLGEIFADAALAAIDKAGLTADAVDLIGSHGQTIAHLPNPKGMYGYQIRSTLQLGEPAVIAYRTRLPTVADFRAADMSAGGEGAPLVPYFDYLLFTSETEARALLNLGGIGNLTLLPPNATRDDVVAFDTGPGNMLLDLAMTRLFNRPFDESGNYAATGKVAPKLLESALAHEYFARTPPKSTGREAFGEDFLDRLLAQASGLALSPGDTIATIAEITVQSVAQGLRKVGSDPIQRLLVSGGGARNDYLMRRLSEELADITVETTEGYGVPIDAKEAICFAVLANETICGNTGNLPSVTGAGDPVILGKVCF